MDDFFKRNQKTEDIKKNNMTMALQNAQQDNEMSMMDPGASRMDRSIISPPPAATPEDEVAGEEPTACEGEEGEGGEEVEGEETTDAAPAEVTEKPVYDKNAMEDMAPAARLRINKAIASQEAEARLIMIEEMLAAERDKDPDALDEDIIAKVNKEVSLKKLGTTYNEPSVADERRKRKAPAIALGTVITT